ncbi:unnamed protein product [Dracunculus medinensis]|uniref:PABS domain-containing protein n=1 Tax=Dracunculus medinensis TaxID=318479 RepID=A0A0N4U6G2_DRAME|nr:unnamed protein product [Dracunculus medinensis]
MGKSAIIGACYSLYMELISVENFMEKREKSVTNNSYSKYVVMAAISGAIIAILLVNEFSRMNQDSPAINDTIATAEKSQENATENGTLENIDTIEKDKSRTKKKKKTASSSGKKSSERKDKLKIGDKFIVYSSNENNFEISDRVVLRHDNSMHVERGLRVKGNVYTTITGVSVIIPDRTAKSTLKIVRFKDITYPINTTGWSIDHSEVPSLYLKYMIAASFATGALSLDESIPGKVLSIGLGGGSIDVTVVEIDAFTVEIATKYFGFHQDERQRCIIEDGSIFIKEAAKKGQKFNVIILDACETKPTHAVCPCKPFTDPAISQYFPKILMKSGVLLVNYLARNEENLPYEELMKSFEPYFEGCSIYQIPMYVNQVC